MQSLQASKVTVTGVCFAFFLLNSICELLLLLLTTGLPGQTTQTSLAPNLFLSSFCEMIQYNVEWTLFHVTPTCSGPTDQPLRQTQAWPKHTEAEQSLCALFPKGCCSGLARVSVRPQWGSRLHDQWPKAGQFRNQHFWKAIGMGARQCCWSAAQALVSSMLRAMGQQETPKYWTGPHTDQVWWLG